MGVALLLSIFTIGLSSQPASAQAPSLLANHTCGVYDEIYVTSASNGKVVAKEGGKSDLSLWKYQDSCATFGYPDVDYFWVPGGCDAWNTATGYKYAGNRTYGPLPGSAYLSLKVLC